MVPSIELCLYKIPFRVVIIAVSAAILSGRKIEEEDASRQ